jgi:HK97 family phage major capsid protein
MSLRVATKPDLTPVVTEQYVKPAKAAGRINLTHELVQDAGDEFTSRPVTDLARSLYNTESNLLLNGTVGANGFAGVNQVSGALTQAIGSDSPLDCISKAMVALRNDFFVPDTIFIHPSTMGALRRIKDSQNRYLLELMSGPRGIDQTAETENLWGVQVIQTTQQAAGSAAVLSVQSGAAVIYVRESLTTFFDPYSQAASNIYQFVSETRLALATPRPSAIALCSGLPTS